MTASVGQIVDLVPHIRGIRTDSIWPATQIAPDTTCIVVKRLPQVLDLGTLIPNAVHRRHATAGQCIGSGPLCIGQMGKLMVVGRISQVTHQIMGK